MADLFSSLKYGFLLWEGQKTMIYNTPQFYSYSLLIYTPTVEWIVGELPTVANTTSTPLGWRAGSHKVMGKDYINTENNKIASIDAMFNSTYDHSIVW